MKKMRKLSATLALVLAVSVAIPSVGSVSESVLAAKKPKLAKTLQLKVKQTKKLSIKNYSKKVTWKVKKASIAKLSAKKKTSVKVTGKKVGKTNITATFKLGGKKKTLTCKVTVKKNAPAPTEVVVTAAPTETITLAPVATPTIDPDATASPTPTHDYDADTSPSWKQDAKIKDLFGEYFVNGISTGIGALRNGEEAAIIRHHFQSITMGNENKMESLVSVEAPEAEKEKYPFGLESANVTNYYEGDGKVILNFDTLEKQLSYCKANNIKVRYHCFIWHSQVRQYFFLQDYNWNAFTEEDYVANGWDVSNYHKLCDQETMRKRMQGYIYQVIDYIYSHGYGDVIYAYDVVNEATNGGKMCTYNPDADNADDMLVEGGGSINTNGGVTTSAGKAVTPDSSPADVEDMMRNEGREPGGSHSYWYATMGKNYIYWAFLDTYNAIQEAKAKYGVTSTPSLIYNDYNTNENSQLGLVDWINGACNKANGTTDVKYCDGIGLQSHSIGVSTQERMIKTIADRGYEVQITELDEGADGDDQASKLKQLYQLYRNYSKKGEYGQAQGDDYIGVTSVTQWGMCDGDGSWGAGSIHYIFSRDPLPDPEFDEEGNKIEVPEPIYRIHPKPAYYGILQAGGYECGDKVY